MDVDILVTRVKNIIIEPVKEWEKISLEQTEGKSILLKYALPLIGLGTFTTFIGSSYVTMSFSLGGFQALKYFMSLVFGLYITIIILNELSSGFGSNKNIDSAYKLMIYSYTASLLASALANLHPNLSFIHIFSLYSIYLLWLGVTPLFKTPDDKKVGFVIIIVLIGIVVSILLSSIVNSIVDLFERAAFL